MKQQIDTFFDAEYESRSKDISYLQRDLIPEYATRKKPIVPDAKEDDKRLR